MAKRKRSGSALTTTELAALGLRSCPRCQAELDAEAWCLACRRYWPRSVDPKRTCPRCHARTLLTEGWCWPCRAWTGPELEREADGSWRIGAIPKPVDPAVVKRDVAALCGDIGRPVPKPLTEAELVARKAALLAQAQALEPRRDRLDLTDEEWASVMAQAEGR